MADGVKAIPRLAECEAKLLVVPDRALKVVDKKLWREGRDARLHRGCSHRSLLSSFFAQDTPSINASFWVERNALPFLQMKHLSHVEHLWQINWMDVHLSIKAK